LVGYYLQENKDIHEEQQLYQLKELGFDCNLVRFVEHSLEDYAEDDVGENAKGLSSRQFDEDIFAIRTSTLAD